MTTRATVMVLAGAAMVALATAIEAPAAQPKKRPRKPKPRIARPQEIERVEQAMPTAAPAKPAKPRKLLVFSKCEGFVHGSIPLGNKCFQIMGAKTGAFTAVVSQDMAMFEAGRLEQFDAVLFNNSTSLKFKNPDHRKALMAFVKSGRGVAGLHAATDNFYNWPEAAEMMGGLFGGHPWGGGGTWAVKLDEPDHPLNKGFGGTGFKIKDEIYKLRGSVYSRRKLRVLLSLDMTDKVTLAQGNKDPKRDIAISWVHKVGKGRAFYCSFGHNNSVYWNPAVLKHCLAGMQYALGDLDVPDSPVSVTAAAAPRPAAVMGDWQGTRTIAGQPGAPIAAQVIALGGGAYRANLMRAFDKRGEAIAVLEGSSAGGKIKLAGRDVTGTIEDGVFAGVSKLFKFEMKKVTRLSPTLGAKPPAGAIVLLGPDTKDLKAEWTGLAGRKPRPCRWKLLAGGVMQCAPRTGSVISKRQFGDHKVHLEFRTPFEPTKQGQGRGNSGVYLQGRYELQILESYGLAGLAGECGGIYGISAPKVNMCAPPLQWQTYDITFRAAKMQGQKVAEHAQMTVLHNGVKIHADVKLPHTTTAAPFGKIGPRGGLYLQDHGHLVEFRNIWVAEAPGQTGR